MLNKSKIWILEDDLGAIFVYREILSCFYEIEFIENIAGFKQMIERSERPDLLIADLRHPDGSFYDLICNEVFRSKIRTPFFIISYLDDLDSLRGCLELGAADYLTKPFKKAELIVKVEHFLKNKKGVATYISGLHGFDIDPVKLQICKRGKSPVQLTSRELQIVFTLSEQLNAPVARDEILKRVWKDVQVGPKTLDVHFVNIRKKIRPLGLNLEFVAPHFYQISRKSDELKRPQVEANQQVGFLSQT